MVESDDEARLRTVAGTPAERRHVWLPLFLAWAAIVVAAWHVWQWHAPPRFPRVELRPYGTYDVVEEIAGPASIRLRDAGTVRLAGILEPEGPPDADRAAAFLRTLLPSGTEVYMEIQSPALAGEGAGPRATVYLPPAQAPQTDPFPYAEAQLVARAMVQAGLVRVDADRLYRYRAEFLLLEADARRHGRGLWEQAPP